MAALLAPDFILSGGGKGATAPWLAYLFLAWAGLIALAWRIARIHARAERGGPDA